MPKKPYDPCKVNACKIQSCLNGKFSKIHVLLNQISMDSYQILESKYQEPACQEVLEAMRQCCIKWKSVSLCCEGIDTDKEFKAEKPQQQNKN